MTQQALAGIKVLDLSGEGPGPFCTPLLGDFGAEVSNSETSCLEAGNVPYHTTMRLKNQIFYRHTATSVRNENHDG